MNSFVWPTSYGTSEFVSKGVEIDIFPIKKYQDENTVTSNVYTGSFTSQRFGNFLAVSPRRAKENEGEIVRAQ